MVAISGLSSLVVLSWEALHAPSFVKYASPHSDAIDIGAVAFLFATAIIFGRWIYVAGTNAIELGHDDLEFSPASRIWWFAVPVLCLFKPFEAMRELWNASHGEVQYSKNASTVTIWWALWLGSTLSGLMAGVFEGVEDGGSELLWWIDAVVVAALSAAAIMLVRGITAAQGRPHVMQFADIFA
nr:DUF4328 domain-containing protein [Sphingomonas tagetis]